MKKAKRFDYTYIFIAILFIAIALSTGSCTAQKNGCPSVRGMSGYR